MNFLVAFLRGDWLSAARVRAGTRMLMLALVAGLIFTILGTHGLIVPLEKPNTTDFVSFYAAGKMAMAGTPALAYDQAAHFAMEQAITEPGIVYQYFFYPPVYMLLCAVLSVPPYLVSFILFQALSLAFFLWVLRGIMGQYRGWAVAALAFPPVYWAMGLGQNSFLTAGLLGLGMLLLEQRRPFLAGLALGAICYKPHFGLLLPLVLGLAQQWRAVAGAAVAVAGLVGLSVLLFGVQTWQAYLGAMAGSRAVYESGAIHFIGMATPFGGAMLLGAAPAIAHAVQLVALCVTALLVGWIWLRGASLPVRAAALASGTLLAVHLALIYDVLLLLLAMAWLVRARAADGTVAGQLAKGDCPGEKTVFFGVYLALLLMTKWLALRGAEEVTQIPLGPLASAAILALCVRRAAFEFRVRISGLAGPPGQTL